MKITDEQVQAVIDRLFLDRGSVDQWGRPADPTDPKSWTRPIQHRVDSLHGRVRDALEAAFPATPQGSCHEGGCVR